MPETAVYLEPRRLRNPFTELKPKSNRLCTRPKTRFKVFIPSKAVLRAIQPAQWGFNNLEPFVNPTNPHAALIASYRKLEAEAKEKLAMAVVAASKGPNAAKACNDTAAKAKRRLQVAAAKLAKHGVDLP